MPFPETGTRWDDWRSAVADLAAAGCSDFQASWLGGVPVLACLATERSIAYLAFGRDGSLRLATVEPLAPPAGEMAVALPDLGPCWHCGRERDGLKDGCLGTLPGVLNACCGHGTGSPYVMLDSGTTLRGRDATEWFRSRGRTVPEPGRDDWDDLVLGSVTVSVAAGHPFVG